MRLAVGALAVRMAAVGVLALAALPLLGPGTPRGWVTTADGSRRVAVLSGRELSTGARADAARIEVDASVRGQPLDGLGAAMTESAAHVLLGLAPAARRAALEALFDPIRGAGVSLLRLPLGASDFALGQYSYDDVPTGRTDVELRSFSLGRDTGGLATVLRDAVGVNPRLAVIASPWSAPAWMKTSGSLVGGSLLEKYEQVYAAYLVRAVAAWRGLGVPVRWLTVQNEPEHAPADYPGMLMPATQQARLAVAVRKGLDAAGLGAVDVVGYDHNWDDPSYPAALLADPDAADALEGVAWHCYAGDPTAEAVIGDAYPAAAQWVTECSGLLGGRFDADLEFAVARLVVPAVRNGARGVLFWNLALDPSGGPHTGGCTSCRGVLTVDSTTGTITRNVEYDVLALTGRAARPGAVRIAATSDNIAIATVAWDNPDGTVALLAYNTGGSPRDVTIHYGHRSESLVLPPRSAVSVVL